MKKYYRSLFPVLILIQFLGPSTWGVADVREILGIEELYLEGVGGWSSTWGTVSTESQPWLHSEGLGWIYLSEDSSPEGYWVWCKSIGWMYSSTDLFPVAYIGSEKVLLDLTEKRRIKYWSFESKEWNIARKDSSDVTSVFDSVPDGLRGLKYSDLNTSIEIGSYYYSQVSRTASGVVHDYYYYNEGDDYFYPLEIIFNTEHFMLTGWQKLKVSKEENTFTIRREDNLFGSEAVIEIYPITME